MTTATASRFPPETRPDPVKGPRRVHVIRCDRACGEEFVIPANLRSRNGFPDDVVAKRAKAAGWRITRSKAVCPSCHRGATGALAMHKIAKDPEAFDRVILADEPPEKREVIRDAMCVQAILDTGYPDATALQDALRSTGGDAILNDIDLHDFAKPKGPPMPEPTTGPRPPSREDKRRILDKLAEVYVSEEVGYATDWTDAKVAASLSVPTAWVADLRVEFHGENGSNEAADQGRRERERALNEIRTDLKGAETRLVNAMADAEKSLSAIRARLDKLEAKS